MKGLVFVGTLTLNGKVSICDPGVFEESSNRKHQIVRLDCEPGEYRGHITKNGYGDVTSLLIVKGSSVGKMNRVSLVGTDTGLLGFFEPENEPVFTEEEWYAFCDKVDVGDAWNMHHGIIAPTDFDGGFAVFANEKRTAFKIDFR